MKKTILIIFALTVSIFGKAQDGKYSPTFEWVIDTFEKNDAGYSVVIETRGRANYDSFTSQMRSKVALVTDKEEFIDLVNEWLEYFREGHVWFAGAENNPFADADEPEPEDDGMDDTQPAGLELKKLSDRTVYVSIPSMELYMKRHLEKLIAENDELIGSTENLIIDIRGSGGGSDITFSCLIPYIYTNPIRNMAVELLGTELNIRGMEFYADRYRKSGEDPQAIEQTERMITRMRNNIGEFILWNDSPVEITDGFPVLPYPRTVAIICDGGNGSSDEQFLLTAKQSFKVKVFGQPTYGALDISNMNFTESPDGQFVLFYAMSRSKRLPEYGIDGVGVQPDFYIDSSIPSREWVDHVREILEY